MRFDPEGHQFFFGRRKLREKLIEKSEKCLQVLVRIQPVGDCQVPGNLSFRNGAGQHIENGAVMIGGINPCSFRKWNAPASKRVRAFMNSVVSEESIGVPFKPFSGQGQIVRKSWRIKNPPKMPVSPPSFPERGYSAPPYRSHTVLDSFRGKRLFCKTFQNPSPWSFFRFFSWISMELSRFLSRVLSHGSNLSQRFLTSERVGTIRLSPGRRGG